MGILGLEDDEFFSNPYKTRDDVLVSLVRDKALGVHLDGPELVDVGARGALMLAVVHVATEPEILQHCFENEAILVANRLEDRATMVARLTEGTPFTPAPGGREGATFASMLLVNAVARLEIPSKPAHYLFGVILRDKMCARIEVKVGRTELGYHDEEVAKFLAAQAQPEPPPVWPRPARPFPDYERRADSPAIPEQPGLAVAAPRVVIHGRNRAVLRLSYRLKVLERDRVRHRYRHADEPKPPAAVLPITLVINGSRDPGPVMLAMHVPVEEQAIRDGEAVGHVALNLFDYPPLGRHEETLFVWAFCGQHMCGPTLIGVVAEDSLPGRY